MLRPGVTGLAFRQPMSPLGPPIFNVRAIEQHMQEQLRHDSLCMSPQMRGMTPQMGGMSPQMRGMTSQMGGMNQTMRGMTPQMGGMSPQMRGMSPQMRGMGLQMRGMSPQMRGINSQMRGRNTNNRILTSGPQVRSPLGRNFNNNNKNNTSGPRFSSPRPPNPPNNNNSNSLSQRIGNRSASGGLTVASPARGAQPNAANTSLKRLSSGGSDTPPTKVLKTGPAAMVSAVTAYVFQCGNFCYKLLKALFVHLLIKCLFQCRPVSQQKPRYTTAYPT